MKVAGLAAFLIFGGLEHLVSERAAGGDAAYGQTLGAFAILAIVAIIVFAYAAVRIEADRRWRRPR